MYFLNYLGPVVLLCVLGFSLYIYVIEFCVKLLPPNKPKQIAFITCYIITLLMLIWCFIRTVFIKNDEVPEDYKFTDADQEKLLSFKNDEINSILQKFISKKGLKIYTRTQEGYIRYCKICRQIKPDRSHHCKTCEACCLKMDHHCPWVSNCIGYFNYKQFILLLLYSTIHCFFYTFSMLEYFIQICRNLEDISKNVNHIFILVGFLMACMFGFLLLCIFIYHVFLLIKNGTTIESIQDLYFEDHLITFDMGKCNNFQEVFGENPCCWFCPVSTETGNGCEFPIKHNP